VRRVGGLSGAVAQGRVSVEIWQWFDVWRVGEGEVDDDGDAHVSQTRCMLRQGTQTAMMVGNWNAQAVSQHGVVV
jgi:hypothetical protein